MPIWISGLSRDEIRNKSIAGAEIKENLKIFLPTPVGFLIIWALKENCLLCVAFLALYFFSLLLLLKLHYNICRVPGFEPEILRPAGVLNIKQW